MTARRLVRGKALPECDAEDIAQESLRRLFVADLTRYAPTCPMSAVVNAYVLREFTKALRKPMPEVLTARHEEEAFNSSATEDVDLIVDLSEALKRCTRRQAGVVLRLIDGLTAVAVASEVGCTAANVGQLRERFFQNYFPEFSQPDL